MVDLLEQLKDSVTDSAKQQINDMLDHVRDDISDAAATLGLEKSPDREDKHGESAVSAEVGSNDETDMLEENILQSSDSQAIGYIGKSSEVQWLQRLQQETEHAEQSSARPGSPSRPGSPYGPPGTGSKAAKRRMEALKQRQQEKPHIPISTSTFYLDNEGTGVDYTVEPYKLPPVEVAQRLLDHYMNTVQDAFPMLPKHTFTDQVRQYYTSMAQGTPYHVPGKWLAILNLVFAIGARYSYLTGADWQADSRDHVIYQSRAHMLNMDEPSLVHQPDLMRVQMTALFAFYSSAVGNVNRAWVAIGIALRYALALGLHLRNEDETTKFARKENLVHAWWALYTLEASMSIIVGRPSLVAEDYYSTPLPLPASTEQLRNDTLLSRLHEQGRGTGLYDNPSEPKSAPSEPSNEGSFLKSMVHISMIAQRAMVGLYAAKVTTKSWKHMQGTITGLCNELELWATNLPSGISFLRPENQSNFVRERLILQMNYIRIKILITRPCLCRLDARIPDQTKASGDFNQKMARTCISAANSFTDTLPDYTNVAYLYQTGPWWSMIHHIMQVLTVLLLEVSYNTVHLPEDDKGILPRIKKLLRWLRVLKEKDRVAARAHDVAFSVLQGLATRTKSDLSDLLQDDVAASSLPAISTPHDQSTMEESDMGQVFSTGEYGYNHQTVDSSMSAFPSALYPDDPLLPEHSSHAGASLSGPLTPYPPFGNAFDNVHDEYNHL
ncbi:DNA binding [Ascochyta rabiei]|uniref:DNA binding n=2 Tax=Didymella rabiei TaxID=5454 RepID=A0A162XC90_DIDRA|nr:DNA binding [Ascochyta rabiei]